MGLRMAVFERWHCVSESERETETDIPTDWFENVGMNFRIHHRSTSSLTCETQSFLIYSDRKQGKASNKNIKILQLRIFGNFVRKKWLYHWDIFQNNCGYIFCLEITIDCFTSKRKQHWFIFELLVKLWTD